MLHATDIRCDDILNIGFDCMSHRSLRVGIFDTVDYYKKWHLPVHITRCEVATNSTWHASHSYD